MQNKGDQGIEFRIESRSSLSKSAIGLESNRPGYRCFGCVPEKWHVWSRPFGMLLNIKTPGRRDPKANIFRLVYNWLRDENSRQCLVILDRVDNPELLSETRDAGQRGQGICVDSKRL